MRRTERRVVYSTERGVVCPRCGWPSTDCRCAAALDQPVPARVTVTLRLERAGRRGKTVTVVDGLPRNRAFLRALVSELKSACSAGGSAKEGSVEVQGDHRNAIRALLASKAWIVKG